MFFTQQVKESSGGLFWALHEWEEQGYRGWREQQCRASCLLFWIGVWSLFIPCTFLQLVDQQCSVSSQIQIYNVSAPQIWLHKHKKQHCTNMWITVHPQYSNNTPSGLQDWNGLSSSQARTGPFWHQEEWLSVAHVTLPYITLVLYGVPSLIWAVRAPHRSGVANCS